MLTVRSRTRRYWLRRWKGTRWEAVEAFNALAVYGDRLYVGGGGHPFDVSEAAAERRALIESFDGQAWTRVPIAAHGQVQAFTVVRGNLCAAVTKFIGPT